MEKMKLIGFTLCSVCIVSAFLITSCPAPSTNAAPLPSSTSGTQQVYVAYDLGSLSNTRVCQGFRLDSAANLDRVELYVLAKIGHPAGDYTVSIRSDNAGKPSNDLVHADATLAKSAGAVTENSWNSWDLPGSFPLAADTTYWIVLTNNESDFTGMNGIYFGYDNANPYADGAMGSYDAMVAFTWIISASNDLKFRAF
jgi:hypothetical protein